MLSLFTQYVSPGPFLLPQKFAFLQGKSSNTVKSRQGSDAFIAFVRVLGFKLIQILKFVCSQ